MTKKHPFGILASLLLFWVLVFFTGRLIFVIYQWPLIQKEALSTILTAFSKGLKMDLSASAYILILPFLSLSINQWMKKSVFSSRFITILTSVVVLATAIITSVELELFVEWESKLNYKALTYLSHPSEVWGVTTGKYVLLVLFLIVFQLLIFYHLYKKVVGVKWEIKASTWERLSFLILTPLILIIMLRGGLQQVPINQSSVYYSESNTLNNAAVNSLWNFVFNVAGHDNEITENPYLFVDEQTAVKTVEAVKRPFDSDSTTIVLESVKPNIVLLILEGWSSDLIEPLGGYSGITPNFNKLCDNGLLFTNIYASGLRSNEGMASIFSGLPAIPVGSITQNPTKYKGLPVLNHQLENFGYNSFFGFGGELEYGNIKGYLLHAGFDELIEGADFSSDIPRAKLGVHDEYALPRFLEEMDDLTPPFFASWFTVSSHAPYDIPDKYTIDINGLETDYINSVLYADKHLGLFMKNAAKKDWYSNTLFIIMADHGHSSPVKRNFYDPDYRKIPLLFFGEPLKSEYLGNKISKIGSQTDLASTLLNQLNLDDAAFKWSKDLLNQGVKEYAYFVFDDGFGWKDQSSAFTYHCELKRFIFEDFANDSAKKESFKKGASYLRLNFEDYINY